MMLMNSLTSLDIKYLENRAKRAIDGFGIDNLMEYTMDSFVGCDLADFYKTVIEEIFVENIYILKYQKLVMVNMK